MIDLVVGIGLRDDQSPTALTIGVFDGVHLGHRAIIDRLVSVAHEEGLTPVVVTFDPYPDELIAAAQDIVLTTVTEKATFLGQSGIERLVVVPFTETMRDMTAEEFADGLRLLQPRHIIIGEDFRFGAGRTGDVVLLRRVLGDDIPVDTMTLVEMDGVVVKSAAIREHLRQGNVYGAARLLGRWYSVTGRVVAGKGKGRRLDAPTANVEVPDRKLIPNTGVYAGYAVLGADRYATALYVTSFISKRIVEVHMIDADVDIYGRDITVEFVMYLRRAEKFDDDESLRSAIHRDIAAARELLASPDIVRTPFTC